MDSTQKKSFLESTRGSYEAHDKTFKNYDYLLNVAIKSFNDTLRVYQARLADMGVALDELSFQEINSVVTTIPAGLVTKL